MRARGEDPEWDHDGEEAKDVKDQYESLDQGKPLGEKGVEQPAEYDNGNGKQGSVPALIDVIGMVEDDEALDLSPREKTGGSCTSLPSKNAEPA